MKFYKPYKSFIFTLLISSALLMTSPVVPKNMDEAEEFNIADKTITISDDNPFYLDKTIIKAVEPVLIHSSYHSSKKV